MALSTAKKVRFLQEYISEWAEKLMAIHYDNITGIRIDKKWVEGHEKMQYAIVFQVKNKIDKTDLKKGHIIPGYFDITFPDGIKRRIKTDIHQTGPFKSQSFIGTKVKCDQYSSGFGSMGLFVKEDDGDTVFAITNFHVVAKKLLKQKLFEYKNTSGNAPNVTIGKGNNTITGVFDSGELNFLADVAFIKVNTSPETQNILPDGSKVKGFWTREGVLSSMKGTQVTIYSHFNPNGASAAARTGAMPIRNEYGVLINDVISLNRQITIGGDSGGLAVDIVNSVIGIVVGGDGASTYLIPFYNIRNSKKCKPI